MNSVRPLQVSLLSLLSLLSRFLLLFAVFGRQLCPLTCWQFLMIKSCVEDNEAHRVVIPDFSIFVSSYQIIGENPPFLAFFTVFGVLFAVHQKLGRCDSRMKCRGRLDASMVEISIPQLFSNYRFFLENHPFLVETFSQPIGFWVVR